MVVGNDVAMRSMAVMVAMSESLKGRGERLTLSAGASIFQRIAACNRLNRRCLQNLSAAAQAFVKLRHHDGYSSALPASQIGKLQQDARLKFCFCWAPCHLVPGQSAFEQDVNQDVQKQSFSSRACKK
jgi:hypothetical protein